MLQTWAIFGTLERFLLRVSEKRWAYSGMLSFSSHSEILLQAIAPDLLLRDKRCHNASSPSNAFASFKSSVSSLSVNQP
jgi:hypothetical protein